MRCGSAARRSAHVDVADRFACECASIDVLELWPEVGHELGDGTADALLDRPAVDVGQRLIDPNDPQIAIDQLEPDRGRRLDTLQEGDRLRGLPLRAAQGELQLLLVFDVGRGAISCVDWFRIDGNVAELYDLAVIPGVVCPMAVSPSSREATSVVSHAGSLVFPPNHIAAEGEYATATLVT